MNFKLLSIKLENLVKQAASKSNMEAATKLAKELVVSRTSRGFGVDSPEGQEKKLKGLSTSYKGKRKKLKRSGKLSSQTTPTKSNLTQTRQMLESVDYQAQQGKGTVFLNDNRAETKAQLQEQQGRKFLNLSKKETKEVTKLIEDQILNDIKKKGL